MRRSFHVALAVVAIAAVPSIATALDTSRTYRVTLSTASSEVDVGTIRFDLDGLVESTVISSQYGTACRYFGRWTNNADLPSRTNLFVDELTQPGYRDCDENAQDFFDTVIINSPDEVSRGFDRRQQRQRITALLLNQRENGRISGVIQFATGSVNSIRLRRS